MVGFNMALEMIHETVVSTAICMTISFGVVANP
jgi:hypothetical protein